MLLISRKRQTGWLLGLLMILGCSPNERDLQGQSSSRNAASGGETSADAAPAATEPVVASAGRPTQKAVSQKMAIPPGRATPAMPILELDGGTGVPEAQSSPTLQAGSTAPDFVSLNLAGEEVRLSDLRDKVVVLDFWATWCGPCLASLPHVQELAKACKDQGVVVLATCTGDTRDKFQQFVTANQHEYPDVVFTCDPNEKGAESFDERASRGLYGVSGIPTQFVIGRDGKIAAVLVGYDEDSDGLEEALMQLGVKLEPAQPAGGNE